MHPDDWPPELGWEEPVWRLFELISTQWRIGMSGRCGLDYGPAIALIDEQRWHRETALRLLRSIEIEILKQDA